MSDFDKNKCVRAKVHPLRLMAVIFAGIIPFGFVRRFVYRSLLKYRLEKGADIGFMTFLDARALHLGEGAYISGVFNVFHNVGELRLDAYSKIGCPLVGLNFISGDGKSTLHLKRGARITWGHFFDLSDNITIGEMTIIGGRNCDFFTHDMYNGKRFAPITIGNACYVGSSCKFAPNSFVADKTVVAMGAVVSGKFTSEDTLIGGVPARVIKENYGYVAKKTYDHLNLKY